MSFLSEYLEDLVIQALSIKYPGRPVFFVNILSQDLQSKILTIVSYVSFNENKSYEFTVRVEFTNTGYKFIGVKNNDNSDPN